MSPEMQSAIQKIIDLIVKDYSKDGTSLSQITKYTNSFRLDVGHKYIKVLNEYGIKFFVVNCTDDKKYPYGTVLKAANWKAPERNIFKLSVL